MLLKPKESEEWKRSSSEENRKISRVTRRVKYYSRPNVRCYPMRANMVIESKIPVIMDKND